MKLDVQLLTTELAVRVYWGIAEIRVKIAIRLKNLAETGLKLKCPLERNSKRQ